ncbi:MAG: hypothetical protein ACJ75H_23935 [Thermoanaerobaculia bacterium]
MKRILAVVLFGLVAGRSAGALQVTLPLNQYEALRESANPSPDDPAQPPAPWALELADYTVAVGPDSARVTQTLRITLYDDAWQTVPLGEAGAFVGADFQGAEGRVNGEDDGKLVMQIRGRGRHEVRLESAAPVDRDETATRPTWRFGLGFPQAAVVRGRVKAPDGVEEAWPEGSGLLLPAPKEAGGGWTFVALPGTEVRFTLAGKATLPERAKLPLRFEATSASAATLSRTRLSVLAWVEARVAQGRLETLKIPVPAGYQIVTVRGPVAGWNVAEGVLIVTPQHFVDDSLSVELEMTAEPRNRFPAPVLLPQGSDRTALLVKAALKGDGLLELEDRGTARLPDEREAARLPESLKAVGGRLFAVGDASRAPTYLATWAERTEVLAAQIDRLLVDVSVGEAGKASYQLWAVVRNRGSQQLAFTLPAGFELAEGSRDVSAVVPGLAGGALAVPLLTQEEPQVVHLAGVLPLGMPKEGALEIPMPLLSAPAARVEVRLVLPGGRSYELTDKSRAGAVSPPPGAGPRRALSKISEQVNQRMTAGLKDSGVAAASLFPVPPGFAEMGAAWSALSANPTPLALRVEARKERPQWF